MCGDKSSTVFSLNSNRSPLDKDRCGAMRLVPLAVLIAIALGAVWSLTYLRQQQTSSIISEQRIQTVETACRNIAYDWKSISYYAATTAGYEVGWKGGSFSDLEPKVESKLQERTFLGWEIPSIRTENLELTNVELALHSSTGTYRVKSVLSGSIEHIVGDVKHSGDTLADVQINTRWGLLNSFVHREHPINQSIARSAYESEGDSGAEQAISEREEDLNDQYDALDVRWELNWMDPGTGVETIARDVRTGKIVPVDDHLEYMLYRLVGGQENETDWTSPSRSLWQTSLIAVVIDDYTGARIKGATVSFNPTRKTNSAGIAEFDLGMWSSGESHQYTVTASKSGYRSTSKQVTLSAGESGRVVLKLRPRTQIKFRPGGEETPTPTPSPEPSEPTQEPEPEFKEIIRPSSGYTHNLDTINISPPAMEWAGGGLPTYGYEEGKGYATGEVAIKNWNRDHPDNPAGLLPPPELTEPRESGSFPSSLSTSAFGTQVEPVDSPTLLDKVASAVSSAIDAVAEFLGF